MYDYGARMYMPDIGRWGVIDPRSQYTHEAYSYVWNNPIFFNDPTGMTGEPCDTCPKPMRTKDIEGVVITAYRPIDIKPAGIDFSSGTNILSGIALQRYPNPYFIGAAIAATIITYNIPKIHLPISGYRAEHITYNSDEPAGAFLNKLSGNDDESADVNGVSVPDDSGYASPADMSLPDPFDPDKKGKKGKDSKPEGLKETKEFGKQHGQKVYQKGNKYYSRDVDSHSGGKWKVFEKVGGRLKRVGTADKNLNIFKK